MTNGLGLECQVCGFVGLDDGSDGFFYCQRCGSQADEIRDTAVDNDEMILTKENVGAIVQRRIPIVKAEPLSQSQPPSQFWETLTTQEDDAKAGDGVGPTEPIDFGRGPRTLTYEDYYSEIRMRYVMGIQIMIELQIKALVEKFNVCPIIVGMVEPIWLRFVASTKLFSDDWADEVINDSESQVQGETEVVGPRSKHKTEPHNILGKRSVMIWYQSVSKTIPLSYSLVISFLVCHLAREPILSTDIVKWTLEGKLPYFAAFVEIEKQIGSPTNACPLSSSRMFRPIQVISIQKLESLAASIAHSIGLELPPVNFYAIASRYLRQLSLPVEAILPHACRIYEWSMPPELWLSANEFRLPTRVCVLSILIVSIRILYNIHGFGKWELALSCAIELSSAGKRRKEKKSNIPDIDADKEKEADFECTVDVNNDAKLSSLVNNLDISEPCSSQSVVSQHELDDQGGGKHGMGTPKLQDDATHFPCVYDSDASATEPYSKLHKQSNLDATEILLVLQSKYNELIDTSDHCKDLQTYLEYCKDLVFAGVELSFEDHEEEQIIEDLWNFYQRKEVCSSSPSCSPHKRARDCSKSKTNKIKKPRDDDSRISIDSKESHKEREIRRMISNMEDNKFCYIPPRTKVKRSDYLHYTRKKGDGTYTYAAHADYYILLRSCARVAQLDVRSMHAAVLSFERRLAWLEKNIDHCLKVMPTCEACELCHDDKSRKKSAKAKAAGTKVSVPAAAEIPVSSNSNEKGKNSRQVLQEKDILPAVPSGPSLGDFVVWKGETANPSPAPAWSTDSGKLSRHTSLRDILKEQEKKVSSGQHQIPVPTQKSVSAQSNRGNGPSWSSSASSPAKAASPIQILSHGSSQSKNKVDDDLFWGPLDHPKQEAKRSDFPQLANQGSWAKNTPGKGISGGSISRQKSVGGRPAETLLSSSPALKGKRDLLAKHSEAMDFRDWCKSECARLLGTKDTSFLEFCLKQSRSEAEILLKENLGSYDPDHEFIEKFLNYKDFMPSDVLEIAFQSGSDEKVSRDVNSVNNGVWDSELGYSKAVAADGGSVKGGGKKKGKKGKKVSPAVLGFNVVSNRIMMGEIETVED